MMLRVSDDPDDEPEMFVPLDDAIAAIKDACGEDPREPELTLLQGFGLLLLTILTSPVIAGLGAAGAVIERCENIISRTRKAHTLPRLDP